MNMKFVCSTAGYGKREGNSARSVCFKEDTGEMEIHSKYFEVRVSLSLNYARRRTKYNRPLAQRSSRQRTSSEKNSTWSSLLPQLRPYCTPIVRNVLSLQQHNYCRRTSTAVGTAATTTVVYISLDSYYSIDITRVHLPRWTSQLPLKQRINCVCFVRNIHNVTTATQLLQRNHKEADTVLVSPGTSYCYSKDTVAKSTRPSSSYDGRIIRNIHLHTAWTI
jgi:hypothetical protein